MALLEVTNIKKIYSTSFGGNKVQALSNVTFSIEKGEFVAIMGYEEVDLKAEMPAALRKLLGLED